MNTLPMQTWADEYPPIDAHHLEFKNPADEARLYESLRKYRMAPEEYMFKGDQQNWKCAICEKHPQKKRLGVDHNHKTGDNRGLLCHKCNMMLGMADDQPGILFAAIRYLKNHRQETP